MKALDFVQPSIVTLGSKTYLGNPLLDDNISPNIIGVENAMDLGSGNMNSERLVEYLKKGITGCLKPSIKTSGPIASGVEELNDTLKDLWTIRVTCLKQAENSAMPNLIKSNFEDLLNSM